MVAILNSLVPKRDPEAVTKYVENELSLVLRFVVRLIRVGHLFVILFHSPLKLIGSISWEGK